ncbi:stress protein [Erwinia sp. OLTSP20]|uniref:Dabb family protein n=1 Tax=unclassified Erwinia TaxID=2622719 RepID=UPI000C17C172|nr:MULTISPECIES: Dabb family protein [unclassified Erwinia]PIJ48602.1 stress protein [Erwinia sp. OAMSP11]PIJ68956.1 stress protein [Erwinia sp. OLSSP12]PIJ78830.1 stress protein [Erwinia sp. OLCASP19]PIJ79920.1 stress protein [Erwinia sp. OLMTSP26]PIJ82038.1 stress protein [Erwinia sp. OLMDSP33]
MIRHILFIAFTDAATQQQIQSVKRAFLNIPQQVEGVCRVEWGVNNSPEGMHAGFSHCVLMTFRDQNARQRYLPHPAHDALKAIFTPVLHDIVVLDYSLTAGNFSQSVAGIPGSGEPQ